MLRYVKLETTQIYTQVSIRQLKQIHTATHPSATQERSRSRQAIEEDQPAAGTLLAALEAETIEEPEQ